MKWALAEGKCFQSHLASTHLVVDASHVPRSSAERHPIENRNCSILCSEAIIPSLLKLLPIIRPWLGDNHPCWFTVLEKTLIKFFVGLPSIMDLSSLASLSIGVCNPHLNKVEVIPCYIISNSYFYQ